MKIGVIGVGSLGQHHARIYSQIQGVEFFGVCDADEKQSRKIAKNLGTQSFTDYKELIGKVDAVSIVVPTPLHYTVAKDFLSEGIHCLVEKPITDNVSHAEELLKIANEKNLVLQIGHIERFNTAVIEAQKYIKEPKFIEAQRLGPYNPRSAHIGVVMDLMIHDIDIILTLVNSKIVQMDVIGAKVLSKNEDIANVRLKFENGCVANISASRVSIDKFRKIRIFQDDTYISLDYADQKLKIYKKKSEVVTSMSDIVIIKPKLKTEEPLKKELEHFVNCVKTGKTPLVTGEHGRDALEVVIEILEKLKL
ncbi:MAG: UDP-N-acetyl-D-glucosamine dehydrogenase [Elusimicrobia bacterium RIFOXYD2_FULL_34_15]|nr:MAG: UDP-N-acetyl-D-glucosamine dehydrogenase [Elusimicrobia bacterium RIFOXYD2_FULL_34_15]